MSSHRFGEIGQPTEDFIWIVKVLIFPIDRLNRLNGPQSDRVE